jgi:hypothetical protein
MIVQYINPFSRAWRRMKNILFKPFNIGKWFALGFTAFLAGLMDSPGGGGGRSSFNKGDFDWNSLFGLPEDIMKWLSENPFWMAVIIAGIVVVIALVIVFTWLSSRGMFMFLDNVVHNRSLIEKPWREFKTHGNSLFLWRLAFGIISFIIFIGFIVAFFLIAYNIYLDGDDLASQLLLILGLVLLGLALFLLVVFISIFLKDFVVPIMYKSGVSVNEAWRRFLNLFSKQAGHFIMYGFFLIGLYILLIIGVVIGGLLTCCCGFLILAIPYIGSVLMLPVSVTFRAFSLEFLEQFGDEYKIFPNVSNEIQPVAEGNIPPVV